jgi:hypothetical protein
MLDEANKPQSALNWGACLSAAPMAYTPAYGPPVGSPSLE